MIGIIIVVAYAFLCGCVVWRYTSSYTEDEVTINFLRKKCKRIASGSLMRLRSDDYSQGQKDLAKELLRTLEGEKQ